MIRTTQWFLRELQRRDEAHVAQVNKLLDRIMFLSGRPWPDAPQPYEPEPAQLDIYEYRDPLSTDIPTD